MTSLINFRKRKLSKSISEIIYGSTDNNIKELPVVFYTKESFFSKKLCKESKEMENFSINTFPLVVFNVIKSFRNFYKNINFEDFNNRQNVKYKNQTRSFLDSEVKRC